ncbi:MAG: 5'/3'-nucleotidase SurE [Candidatus Omnitrophica bacterium]|nr:5'/3'-nucleotidase SurE [Candidatus Omnitrophota bacterium]MCM8788465.1 5'/3'-nucleotidase SurE [Candidatus Omnitrophota bacterium]
MRKLALVSNDDGIFADGLNILCEKLAGEFEVAIVAPDSERSNVGHAITLSMPLKVEKVKTPCGIIGCSVSGMPADCIKIAVSSLLDRKPDIVVSGINLGSNLGIDVLYSGTVSAATEAVIMGIPAFAISLDMLENPDFSYAASFAKKLAILMVRNRIPENIVLNVNVPDRKPCGVKLVPLSKARYRERYEKRINPRKKEYWWLTGEFMEETDTDDSDTHWLKKGFITITPLNIDLTDYECMNLISEWKFEIV